MGTKHFFKLTETYSYLFCWKICIFFFLFLFSISNYSIQKKKKQNQWHKALEGCCDCRCLNLHVAVNGNSLPTYFKNVQVCLNLWKLPVYVVCHSKYDKLYYLKMDHFAFGLKWIILRSKNWLTLSPSLHI